MTMIEPRSEPNDALIAGMPRVEVAPPSLSPRWYGLYSVADVRTSDARDPWATVWEDNPTNPTTGATVACATPMNKGAGAGGPDWAYSSPPYCIFAADRCAPVGRSDGDAEARARLLLEAGEQDQAVSVGVALMSTATDLGASIAPEYVLGKVEQALCARPGQGAIWLGPLAATVLAVWLDDDDTGVEGPQGMLRTTLGTPVVVSQAVASGLIYGSGPVTVERGRVETMTAFDRPTNTRIVIAERVVVVTVAQPWCKATITPPA